MNFTYQDALAHYGIGGAHPGGLSLTKEILSKEQITKQTKFLDAGCGTGQTAAYLARTYPCFISAIDHHPVMVKKAKQRFNNENIQIDIHEGSIEKTSFEDNTFDIILSESVTVFTNISTTLKEYYRILKPGGVLIDLDMTAEPALDEIGKDKIKKTYNINEVLTEKEWLEKLTEAGFHSIDILYSDTVYSQIKKSSETVNQEADFNLSKSIDPKLSDIMHQHYQLTNQYAMNLGHRVFRAVR
ncbi:class I SAM-dependent methyltransferase [Heyndrickxia acidicola]|uniref:Class I SAM-dependent methyltransferase n=1 Tax=Heyndrickxia acidicola TaxID=209389 RepID=A0ABU6MKA1_9BACI|nr:class I SAM-dependent methyltransferase [Heyndrickxia acidicola]MED1204073.1 class I SAM-dependent methyltransferase [Heyndrickxia acidicola]